MNDWITQVISCPWNSRVKSRVYSSAVAHVSFFRHWQSGKDEGCGQLFHFSWSQKLAYSIPSNHLWFFHRCYGVERCMPAGSMFVRSFVRVAVRSCVRTSFCLVTKCAITYYEQTAWPRSANFWKRMQVDNLPSPINFHPNPQRPWPSISRSKIRIEYIGRCIQWNQREMRFSQSYQTRHSASAR